MVEKLDDPEFLAELRAARAAGRKAQRQPWWAVDVGYDRSADRVVIEFRNGISLGIPRAEITEFDEATRDQLEAVTLVAEAIRLEELDLDVSVPGLITDLLGPHFSTAASGRRGGRSQSTAKAAAARANGAKGGRPRRS